MHTLWTVKRILSITVPLFSRAAIAFLSQQIQIRIQLVTSVTATDRYRDTVLMKNTTSSHAVVIIGSDFTALSPFFFLPAASLISLPPRYPSSSPPAPRSTTSHSSPWQPGSVFIITCLLSFCHLAKDGRRGHRWEGERGGPDAGASRLLVFTVPLITFSIPPTSLLLHQTRSLFLWWQIRAQCQTSWADATSLNFFLFKFCLNKVAFLVHWTLMGWYISI